MFNNLLKKVPKVRVIDIENKLTISKDLAAEIKELTEARNYICPIINYNAYTLISERHNPLVAKAIEEKIQRLEEARGKLMLTELT